MPTALFIEIIQKGEKGNFNHLVLNNMVFLSHINSLLKKNQLFLFFNKMSWVVAFLFFLLWSPLEKRRNLKKPLDLENQKSAYSFLFQKRYLIHPLFPLIAEAQEDNGDSESPEESNSQSGEEENPITPKQENTAVSSPSLNTQEPTSPSSETQTEKVEEEQKLEQVMKEQNQNTRLGSRSQEKVDQYADETFNLLQDYNITLNEIENYRTYNAQLKKNIADQESEKASIKEQIEQIKKTRKEIVPFMTKMLGTLREFIDLDVPFLEEERRKRLTSLMEMMDKAKFSVSEKYRKIMEAYQFEMEYGKTIETYTGKQQVGDKQLVVNYLRLGRLGFFYQTLDAKTQGFWNVKTGRWEPLTSGTGKNLAGAIEIAKKLKAPSLITLPLTTAHSYQQSIATTDRPGAEEQPAATEEDQQHATEKN